MATGVRPTHALSPLSHCLTLTPSTPPTPLTPPLSHCLTQYQYCYNGNVVAIVVLSGFFFRFFRLSPTSEPSNLLISDLLTFSTSTFYCLYFLLSLVPTFLLYPIFFSTLSFASIFFPLSHLLVFFLWDLLVFSMIC